LQKFAVRAWLLHSNQQVPDGAWTLLHESELAACNRYVRECDRRAFASTRAALRCLLGRELGVAPRSLEFAASDLGKPELRDQRDLKMHFSVSHTDDCSLIAISRASPVGVDIERRRPVPERSQIAVQVFGADAAAYLQHLPADRQDEAFLRLWTAGEACLKARGLGLVGAGGRAPVTFGPGELQICCKRAGMVPDLTLRLLVMPYPYVGALALRQRDLAHPDLLTPERIELARLLCLT
jgi:4'-phosphopantetheinyl transferase